MFRGADPHGTNGKVVSIGLAQVPPDMRLSVGRTVITYLIVNGSLTVRNKDAIVEVIRTVGLGVIMGIIYRDDGGVVDSGVGDVDFRAGLQAVQISPGIVYIEIPAAGIDAGMIADGIIAASHLAAGAVGNVALADAAVDNRVLGIDAVHASNIFTGSVGEDEIATGAVTTPKLAVLSIGTNQLANNAVTAPKLASNSVGSAVLMDGAVGTAELATWAVTNPKIAANAIDSLRLIDAAVTNAKLGSGSVDNRVLANDAVSTANMQMNAVDSYALAQHGVTFQKLASDALGPLMNQASQTTAETASSSSTSAYSPALTLNWILPAGTYDCMMMGIATYAGQSSGAGQRHICQINGSYGTSSAQNGGLDNTTSAVSASQAGVVSNGSTPTPFVYAYRASSGTVSCYSPCILAFARRVG